MNTIIPPAPLEEYEKAVKELARTDSAFVFDNEGVPHASIVMSTIFDYSKEVVKLYTTSMSGVVSNNKSYRDAITNHLSQGKKLQILLDSNLQIQTEAPEGSMNTLSKLIKDFARTNLLEVKIASEDFKTGMRAISSEPNVLYHFAIGDKKMFRIETNSETHEALCCFNSEKTATILSDTFDKYFGNCSPAIGQAQA